MTGLVPTLTVVTYNVRAAIGAGPFPPAWWRHIRRERMERIAAIIRDLHPDVVSLQEVGLGTVDGVPFEQATELAALTGLEVRYGAAHHEALVDPEDGRAVGAYLWGNAVLSRWPFLWSRLVALPTAADDDLVEPADGSGELAGVRYADAPFGVRERRSLLECEVAVGDTRVTVLATHLTHVGAAQRAGQARHIADMVASLPGPLVVAGDLNAPLDGAELSALREPGASHGGLVDAFAATGIASGDPLRHSCDRHPIDQILVRRLIPLTCRVVREAGDASDHWPVVATFSL